METLELRCDEFRCKIEEMQQEEKKRQRRDQRTWSVPSLTEASDLQAFRGSFDHLGFPAIFDPLGKHARVTGGNKTIRDLKDNVRTLKLELNFEKRKRSDAESGLSELVDENEGLREDLRLAEKEKDRLEAELHDAESKRDHQATLTICKSCGIQLRSLVPQTSKEADPNMIEHDLNELPRGQLVRLKNGGSAFGSRESLNKLGLEPDDTSPTKEHCSAILASGTTGYDSSSSEGDVANLDDVRSPDGSMSILGELENQYRRLVRKYEHLVEKKNKRKSTIDMSTQDNLETPSNGQAPPPPVQNATTPQKDSSGVIRRPKSLVLSREAQTAYRRSGCYDLPSADENPVEGHFDKGPPEYKKLFKEIFETLQRSVYVEDATSPMPKSYKET